MQASRKQVKAGVDEGLHDHLRKLTHVLMMATRDDMQAIDRFELGLMLALERYDEILQSLDDNEAAWFER